MTAVVLGSSMAPASAESELQLSIDAVHWVDAINDPLFDPTMRWVPGDSETATFFIRNQGGTPGDLTVDVLGSETGELMDSGDLHIKATGGGGKWTVVSDGGTHRLLTSPHIPDGQVVPIDISVTFDASSQNPTQLDAAEIDFLVTMSQAAPADPVDDDGGILPGTGAPDARWFAAIGAMLIGAGLAFFTRRRTEDGEDAHV